MSTEQTIEFISLTDFSDYEILNQYPFTIRKKNDHYIVKETINKNNGYPSVNLYCKKINKHQLIAKQFIPNDDPEHKTQIDHINHNKTDYHLENLRWVSSSENIKNTSSRNGVEYEFIDNIPDEAIVINHYYTKNGRKVFNESEYYYYRDEEADKDIFYLKITNELYRIMYINKTKSGRKFVMARDNNHKKVAIYIHNFKYQYGLD
ncbi:hypothetical protein M9Y10_014837 [Tritrichomonas musculus]|uniref:HNH nuclease domain-containing protein n=1 Tax=Tritrichomonas musculus TaxID=1915356 RepID=A0ABR2L1Q6_9EUKA